MNAVTASAAVTTIAAGLASVFVGLAGPAAAAPAGGNAQDTIAMLEMGGNRVIVNRLSDTPLSQATVVGIQPGSDIRMTVWDNDHDRTYEQVITGMVYYVDVQ